MSNNLHNDFRRPLNLPVCSIELKESSKTIYIKDHIRKKWLQLTPEEWVRQHFIHFLIEKYHYPASLFEIEKAFSLNGLEKRADILIRNLRGEVSLLVECKAPHIKLNQKTFDQIARYNMKLEVPYLIVTNGLEHFICKMNYQNSKYDFLEDIPYFKNLD